ncbi:hypothetical protein [Frateuria sp. STR12]|uniref:hypothetical protein n=1 Tax=Frateuria hangzhouensis TaxID=2995589 RepID=UPI002260CF61|nr:hypothetical protein [Frateuria sp. STR12]MCX7515395.1 hypothetical protein [Frateuria sp. STR12]
MTFSLYTEIQAKFLLTFGRRIFNTLDQAFLGESSIDGASIQDAWGMFWLWTLGAYEVLRVMKQKDGAYFSERIRSDLMACYKILHKIRIPFAKQQIAGKTQPVYAELSYCNLSDESKDMAFEIQGSIVWIRPTIKEFERFIGSIKSADIVGRLPLGPRD